MPTTSPPDVPNHGEASRPAGQSNRIGWWLVLTLCPLVILVFIPAHWNTSGSNRPQMEASTWAATAIGLRAGLAVWRSNRSGWWSVYLAFYFFLMPIADFAAESARNFGF